MKFLNVSQCALFQSNTLGCVLLMSLLQVACTSREQLESAPKTTQPSPLAAPTPKPLEPVFHLAPMSEFDKLERSPNGRYSVGMGLVSSTESGWVCASRPEVTICRGKNGTGQGSVLWIRYRGQLNALSTPRLPVYVRVAGPKKFDSFAMSKDNMGSYVLITDGLLFCSNGSSSRIYGSGASSSCKGAPPRMKNLMGDFIAAPGSSDPADWKVNLQFAVTVQKSPQDKKRTEQDKGTPPFQFTLPAYLEGSDPDMPVNPDDVPAKDLSNVPLRQGEGSL